MEFECSANDLIALETHAWNIYKLCKDAPGAFKIMAHDILSFHAVLKEVGENLLDQTLSGSSQFNLKTVGHECHYLVQDLHCLLDRYESLTGQKKRTWDQVWYVAEDIVKLRSRLTSNIVLVAAFMGTLQNVVENKLKKFMQAFQDGKQKSLLLTTREDELVSLDETHLCRSLQKELKNAGISATAFDANKAFIIDWYKEALNIKIFEEQLLRDDSSTIVCENDLSQPTKSLEFFTTVHSVPQISDIDTLKRKPAPSSTKPQSVLLRPVTALKAHIMTERVRRVVPFVKWILHLDRGIICAASRGDTAMVKFLLDKGVNVNTRNVFKETALHYVACSNYEAIMKVLLERNNIQADLKDDFGMTPLSYASENGYQAIVNMLLERNDIDVNSKCKNGRTPLSLAAGNGNEAIVYLLLENGAHIDAQSNCGLTALHYAAYNGFKTTVELLLRMGADADIKDDLGLGAVFYTARNGHEVIHHSSLEKGGTYQPPL